MKRLLKNIKYATSIFFALMLSGIFIHVLTYFALMLKYNMNEFISNLFKMV